MRVRGLTVLMLLGLLSGCGGEEPTEQELITMFTPVASLFGIDATSLKKDECFDMGNNRMECAVTVFAAGTQNRTGLRLKVEKNGDHWLLLQ